MEPLFLDSDGSGPPPTATRAGHHEQSHPRPIEGHFHDQLNEFAFQLWRIQPRTAKGAPVRGVASTRVVCDRPGEGVVVDV